MLIAWEAALLMPMLRSITDTTDTKLTTTQIAGLNATAICNLSTTQVST